MIKISFLFIVIIALPSILYGQFYSTGNEPFQTKWDQIQTSHFQLIYPKNFYTQANQLANNIEQAYFKVSISDSIIPKRFPVILHNQTIISNGYVVWAPKRMELYATPPQDNFSQEWLEHLSLHELRHVFQINQLNQGVTKGVSFLFGEIPVGIVSGMLPLWYWEGDAVLSETIHSKNGRGSLPSFERDLRTHFLSDDKTYSFDKMLFGSYKDYVPNHYESGYIMASHLRNKHGSNVFAKVEDFVCRNPFPIIPTPLPFSVGLKKETGLTQRKLYDEAFTFMDSVWAHQDKSNVADKNKYIHIKTKSKWVHYLNPWYESDSSIIVLKESLERIPAFVRLKNNEEDILYQPGRMTNYKFSYAAGHIAWSELKYDTRYENRQFSIIKILNIQSGMVRVLDQKSRYFSPMLSNSGEYIVAIEIDEQNNYYVIVLHAFSGRVIEKIPSFQNRFIQIPAWSNDLNKIYTIELTDSGKQVVSYDRESAQWETLLSLNSSDIQHYKIDNSGIYYHSTQSGIDNIYFYDFTSKKTISITNSRFGTGGFNLNANGDKLIVSENTSHGFKIYELSASKRILELSNKYQVEKSNRIHTISQQESGIVDFSNRKLINYESKPYRKWINLFDFHSWVPFYFDPSNYLGAGSTVETESIGPGLMLFSQNKLSTANSYIGYGYRDGSHQFTTSFIYKGMYPVIEINTTYGYQEHIYKTQDATWEPEFSNNGYNYSIKTYVPFNLSSGKNIIRFQPSIELEYNNGYYYNYVEDVYHIGLMRLRPRILFYAYTMMAHKDLLPRWGVFLDYNAVTTPFENDLFGSINYTQATLYAPSFLNNHGFRFRFGYQKQKVEKYMFGSGLSFPRGYNTIRTEELSFIKSDYIFPITYPDWNLGSFAYLKRIRGDVFFDYGINHYRYTDTDTDRILWYSDVMTSTGVEIMFDYHLFRMIFPFSSGFRYSFGITDPVQQLELVFNIELNGF